MERGILGGWINFDTALFPSTAATNAACFATGIELGATSKV